VRVKSGELRSVPKSAKVIAWSCRHECNGNSRSHSLTWKEKVFLHSSFSGHESLGMRENEVECCEWEWTECRNCQFTRSLLHSTVDIVIFIYLSCIYF
jgi:hypothetical protein